ncbi:hypothetical protein BN1723_005190 [Verticillium longisporum]|nr:hypothetical protein BN1723_005190 [Verticillium longisporum]
MVYGKPCPGYTDTFHFRVGLTKTDFEVAPANALTSSVSGRNERRGIPKSLTRQSSKRSENTVLCLLSQSRSEVIYRSPELPDDQISLCYFVKRFVSPDDTDGVSGHLSFLPALYDHSNRGILETATMSVAHYAAFNRHGSERFRLQSYRYYSRTIKMLQEAMQVEGSATDDKIVTTILLMCMLKDISGEGSGDSQEHAPGLFYLLEQRGPDQIISKIGAQLFLLAHLRLQTYSFLNEDDRYSDPGAIASLLGMFDPLIRAMSMMSRVLSLKHTLTRYLSLNYGQRPSQSVSPASPEGQTPVKITSTIRMCFEALEDFARWDAEAGAYWEQSFVGRTVPTMLGQVASGMTSYDADTACIIILIRSPRLILLLTMLLYYGKTQTGPVAFRSTQEDSAAWEACVSFLEDDVRKTIDDIIYSVPYALGNPSSDGQPASMPHDGASALIIVQSIRLVAHCAYSTPNRLQKAQSILNRINTTIGIRSALGWEEGGTAKISNWIAEQEFLRSMISARSKDLLLKSDMPIASTYCNLGQPEVD